MSCSHAIIVWKSKYIDKFGPYCFEYYKPITLVKTYKLSIIPMPDNKDWHVPKSVEEEQVLPPKYKRLLERPKKEGKRNKAKLYHQIQIVVDGANMQDTIEVLITFFWRIVDLYYIS